MKIVVTHDEHGNIVAIGSPAPHLQGVGIKPKPGRQVSILEAPEIEHPGHFAKCLSEFRVETGSGRPKLVKK